MTFAPKFQALTALLLAGLSVAISTLMYLYLDIKTSPNHALNIALLITWVLTLLLGTHLLPNETHKSTLVSKTLSWVILTLMFVYTMREQLLPESWHHMLTLHAEQQKMVVIFLENYVVFVPPLALMIFACSALRDRS